jgi:hypothetical protein
LDDGPSAHRAKPYSIAQLTEERTDFGPNDVDRTVFGTNEFGNKAYANQGGLYEMGIGVSLILIAVGAVLTWAVDATVSGLDINAVGVILMIVGAVGMLLSLMFWSSWGGWGHAPAGNTRRTTTTVDDAPPPGY